MMASVSVSEVSKNVATGGGTAAAISGMSRSSGMMPAPLGIAETRPMASAPCATAMRASAADLMQQILMRVRGGMEMIWVVARRWGNLAAEERFRGWFSFGSRKENEAGGIAPEPSRS